MARASMVTLISRVRNAIADPEGATQTFTDDEIEEVLDANSERAHYLPLDVEPTLTSSTTTYTKYHTPDEIGNWEDDALLYNSSYAALATISEDYIRGRWTLSTSTMPPVYLVGATYDVNGAARDLLKRWAAKLKLEYGGSLDGDTYNRDEQYRHLMRLADYYGSQMRLRTLRMVRSDVASI